MTVFLYTVEGSGPFPVDMLRYDQCWPCDPESASLIAYEPVDDTGAKLTARREIRIASSRGPTKDRWKSFGWVVKEQFKS